MNHTNLPDQRLELWVKSDTSASKRIMLVLPREAKLLTCTYRKIHRKTGVTNVFKG